MRHPSTNLTQANITRREELEQKRLALEAILASLGRTLIAYSGGVDSAFLAYASHQLLADQMLAVIADSPSLARVHLADALAFAKEQGIPVEVISTSELDKPDYVRNDAGRCFHCKDELFTVMKTTRIIISGSMGCR